MIAIRRAIREREIELRACASHRIATRELSPVAGCNLCKRKRCSRVEFAQNSTHKRVALFRFHRRRALTGDWRELRTCPPRDRLVIADWARNN